MKPPIGAAARMTPFARLSALALAAVLLVACTVRLAPIPGVEWYLGPFVYLIVLRRWGLVPGLIAAAVTMAPSLMWWGHPWSLLIALGHVLFVHWRGRDRLMVPSTLIFALIVHFSVGFPVLTLTFGATLPVILLVVARKVINDVVCAALADILLVNVRLCEDGRIFSMRRPIQLGHFVRAWSHVGLLSILLTAFISGIRDFREDFGYYQQVQLEAARNSLRELQGSPGVGPKFLRVRPVDEDAGDIAVARRIEALDLNVARRLGCHSLGSELQVKSFDALLDKCTIREVGITSRTRAYVMMPDRAPAQRAYDSTIAEIAPLGLLAVALAFALTFVQREVETNVGDWRDVLAGFGRRRLAQQPAMRFVEFSAPLAQYVEANNAYVDSRAQESEHREAFNTLKQSLDLSLIRDIRYDPGEGAFHYQEFFADGRSVASKVIVNVADREQVVDAMRTDFSVEFRPAGETSWRMISGQGRREDGAFDRGVTFRLRQPRMSIAVMRHRAEVHEWGVSAASTLHEVQQPLFVIGLTAEQGVEPDALQTKDPAAARAAFERILAQVQRTQKIIERVSRRVRADGAEDEVLEPQEVIADVLSDLRAQLTSNSVCVKVDECDPTLRVTLPRLSFEQVLTNALRNATDSIRERKAGPDAGEGRIDISVTRGPKGEMRLSVRDNGMGPPDRPVADLFEPFITTKPVGEGTGLGLYVSRELAQAWGGDIELTSVPAPGRGAVFTLVIPPSRVAIA